MEHQLFYKLSKCILWQRKIGFLGHVFYEAEAAADLDKINEISDLLYKIHKAQDSDDALVKQIEIDSIGYHTVSESMCQMITC